MSEDKLEIRFKYSEDEYCRALRLYHLHTKMNKFDIIFFIIAIILIVFSRRYLTESWLGTVLLIVLVIWVIVVILSLFIIPRIHYRQNPKLRDECFLTFSENGIKFKTSYIDSNIEWSLYNKIWESKEFYYLFHGKAMFSIIPKRAFVNEQDENRFKAFLNRKISEEIKKNIE